MKIKIDTSESKGKHEVVFIGTSLKAYLIRRIDKPDTIRSSVYILMDDRRTGFYIGESGDTDGGGFVNRIRSHVSKKTEKWWNIALCFTDSSELFDKVPVRKWIESRLNEIARDNKYIVLSTAGASGEAPPNAERKLKEILDVCWLLGVPWARAIEDVAEVSKGVKSAVKDAPKHFKGISPSMSSHSYSDCPYSVASIMGAVVLELNNQGKLAQEDVDYLLSHRATLDLKMCGNRYLKVSTGTPNEHKNAKGVYRFMPDRKLEFGSTTYLLSRQLFPKSFDAVVEWIGDHGFSLQQAINLCQKAKMKPKR